MISRKRISSPKNKNKKKDIFQRWSWKLLIISRLLLKTYMFDMKMKLAINILLVWLSKNLKYLLSISMISQNLLIELKNNMKMNLFGKNYFFQILASIGMKEVSSFHKVSFMIRWFLQLPERIFRSMNSIISSWCHQMQSYYRDSQESNLLNLK